MRFLQQLAKICGVSKAALIAHNLHEKDHRMLATLGDSVDESIPLYEVTITSSVNGRISTCSP